MSKETPQLDERWELVTARVEPIEKFELVTHILIEVEYKGVVLGEGRYVATDTLNEELDGELVIYNYTLNSLVEAIDDRLEELDGSEQSPES